MVYAERLPPHDGEAEAAVLGSVMLDSARWPAVRALLTAEDFYSERYAIIFKAMETLDQIDQITVTNALPDGADITVPSHCVASVATPLHAEHYARIVRALAARRRAITYGGQIAAAGYDGDPVIPLIRELEEALAEPSNLSSTKELSDKYFNEIEDEIEGEVKPMGLSTGLLDLDRRLNGLGPGRVYVIAGATGLGKTTFALNVTAHVALTQTVVYVSLEMTERDLLAKLMYSQAGIDRQNALRLGLTATQKGQLRDTWEDVQRLHLFIDDNPGLTCSQMHGRLAGIEDLGMVVVDYLTLLQCETKMPSRYAEVTYLARELKRVARELNVPLLELVQLNREHMGRVDKRPQMSDLKESGEIENTADAVLLLYHYDHYVRAEGWDHRPDREHVLEIGVPKNRFGSIGKETVYYDPDIGKVRNLQRG